MTRFTRVKSTHQRVEGESTSWKELKDTPAKDDTKNHKSFAKNGNSFDANANGTKQSSNPKSNGFKKGNFKDRKSFGGGGGGSSGNFKGGNSGNTRTRRDQSKSNNKSRREPEESANFTPLGGKNNPNVRGEGESKSVKVFGNFWVGSEDARRLQGMAKTLKKDGVPRKEILKSLQNERRKAEKVNKRRRDKTCYNCRQFGHVLADCPGQKSEGKGENGEDIVGKSEGDICFKCGSTEHTSRFCKRKADKFNFAKCFVCSQTGHIARQCPSNTNGIYPAGGNCDECGSVAHLKKDCPELLENFTPADDNDPKSQVGRISDPFVSTEYEEIPMNTNPEDPEESEGKHLGTDKKKFNNKTRKLNKREEAIKRKAEIEDDFSKRISDDLIKQENSNVSNNDAKLSPVKSLLSIPVSNSNPTPKKRRVKF